MEARPTHPTTARVPSSRPSLSLRGLERFRGIITSRIPRPSGSLAHSTSNGRIESEARHGVNNFPDLVHDILQRARAPPMTPEQIFDENSHVPHVQIEGRKIWEEFQAHTTALEKDLQKFQDAVQELGSSLPLTRAARDVRESISRISQIFQENARKLFPLAVIPQRLPRMGSIPYGRRRPQSWRPRMNTQFNADRQAEDPPIYVELKVLADSIEYLRCALEQFPEFRNNEVIPLMWVEADLKYWSSNLEHYRGQLESREVQCYIHDLSRELSTQFDDTGLCIREFIDGVPYARLSQKHDMSNLQSLATIATFFSAVTATTIQYSYAKNNNGVDKAVNVFWFNSLVFSIASALNSFLVLTWRKANYSSPRLRIPWWLWLWIRQCPTIFLFISVVTFLAGLGCFTVSSGQAHFTAIIVIISEAISAFGLAALIVWLACDKWVFQRHPQKQFQIPGFSKTWESLDNMLPSPNGHTPSWHFQTEPEKFGFITESTTSLARTTTNQSTAVIPPQRVELARQRWTWAIRNVILVLKAIKVERGREFLESLHMDNTDPRLRKLHELTRLEAGGNTSDFQFDPDGKFLAVCGKSLNMRYALGSAQMDPFRLHIGRARQMMWSSSGEYLTIRTSDAVHVLKMGSEITHQSIIIRNDILWYTLIIPNAGDSINRPPKLITIEGAQANKLVLVDTLGQEDDVIHDFKDLSIQHIDVAPDGTRVLIAAVIPDQVGGVEPMKALPGRKLMVFNLRTRRIEHQVPLWFSVQHVTISTNGRWAVVTYRDSPPPQLWHLRRTPNGIQLHLERQFCARERVSVYEFDPSLHIRFAGRGHFVNNDRYVLCTTVDGKIHIWRRDRAHPVHVHGGRALEKDKPVQIACNNVSNTFMFATRSRNGEVRIWKIQDPPSIEVEAPGRLSVDPSNSRGQGIIGSRDPMTESPLNEQPSDPVIDSEVQRGGME